MKTLDEEFCTEPEFEALGHCASKQGRGAHLSEALAVPNSFWYVEWTSVDTIPMEGNCVVFFSIPWATPNGASGEKVAVYVRFNGVEYMNPTGWKYLPENKRRIFGSAEFFVSKVWVQV